MNQSKPAVAPIKSSTQAFLEIEDIKDGIIILKDGSSVLVITTTAINFGLLSEREQDTAIYAYGALLNSLTFSVQILIRSKRKDITAYLNLLAEQEKKVSRKLVKEQIQKYRAFVANTVQVNNVLEKSFYLIIPMSFLELGLTQTMGSKLKKSKGLPYPKEYILDKAKTNLHPKRDHLFRLLNRLGLRSRQLDTQELVKLFFEIYNPDSHGQILSTPADYQTPMVKPAASFLQETLPASPASPPPQEAGSEPVSFLPPSPQTVKKKEESSRTPPQTFPPLSQEPVSALPKPAAASKEGPEEEPIVVAETTLGEEPKDKDIKDKIDQLVKEVTQPSEPEEPPITSPGKSGMAQKSIVSDSPKPIFDAQENLSNQT